MATNFEGMVKEGEGAGPRSRPNVVVKVPDDGRRAQGREVYCRARASA